MTYFELSNIILKKYYEKRKEDPVLSLTEKDFDEHIDQSEIYRISQQLDDDGFIQFDSMRGNDKIVDGVGRITVKGIRHIESKSLTPARSAYMAPIRRALTNAFDDVGLNSFCLDYFESVYDQFSRGMHRNEKINLLLNHCRRSSGFACMLQAVEQEIELSPLKEKQLGPLLNVLKGPQPYFAHPSPQQANFTGRVVEREMISDWLTKDQFSPERCDFYQHIPLPPNYIVRADLLAEVRANILANTNDYALTSGIQSKPHALHGMGGIGKTMIARAICEDATIRATFHDGILWTTLGQRPNLEIKLREWINVLGDVVSETAPTIDTLKVKLAKLLEKRASLLIVDDVWQRNHAKTFLVGGPNCRLLLTTRDAVIANDLSATIFWIPLMTSDEAMTLLTDWGGSNLASVPSDLKEQIVNRLGCLPLAVKLAGAQLRRKEPAKWLATFDIRQLKSRRIEDVHDSLARTFELSLNDLSEEERHLYLLLGIFKEDESIPLIAIERLWGTLGNLDGGEIADLVDYLAARALLEVMSTNHSRAVVLHDLLRDLMRVELGDDRYTDAHRVLLNAYRETQQGEGWGTAPSDGYLYDHLAYHLIEAKQEEELRLLLLDSDWLRVQRASDPALHTYTQDVRQVVEIAQAQGINGLSDVVAFSLLHGTLVSRASNIPVTALNAMVLRGEVDQALRYAELTANPSRQTNAYAQIGIQLHKQGRLAKAREVLARAWNVTNNIDDSSKKARALSKICQALNQIGDSQQAQKALEYLLSVTEVEVIEEDSSRAVILLEEVLAQLNKAKQIGMLVRIQNVAEHIENERERIRILCRVVQSLTQLGQSEQAHEVLSRTKAVVAQVLDMSWRAEGLSRIALCQAGLGETNQASQTINHLLAEIERLENKSRYGMVLSIMFDVLEQLGEVGHTNQLLERMLMIAKDIDHGGWALRLVGLHVAKEGDLDHALLIAQGVKNESHRLQVLTRVARSLIQSTKFEQALSMTSYISLEWALADLLKEIAEEMVKVGALEHSLEVAKSIKDEIKCAEALSTIALALTEMGDFDKSTQLLDQVIAIAEVSDDRQHHAQALSEVALALFQADQTEEAKRVFQRALMLAKDIRHKPHHVRVLTKVSHLLAQVGDTEQANQVLSQAMVIAEEAKVNWGASLISDTAQALAEIGQVERAQQVLTDVLEFTKASQDGFENARTLNTVAQCLIYLEKNEEARAALDQALAAADNTESEYQRPWGLSEVAVVLIELGEHEEARQIANRALPMAESIQGDRAISYVALVLALVGEIERALAIVERVEDKDEAAIALHGVVCTLLEQGDYDRALAITDDMIDDIFGQRALALCDYAQKLIKERKPSQARQVLRRAFISAENENMWTKDGWRPRALNYVSHSLTQVLQPNETEIVDWVITAFRLARNRGRTEVWSHIEAFARVLGKLGVTKDVWLKIQAVEALWSL